MARATFGRYVVAIGGNPEASALAGVPVRRTLLAVYILSAALAAVAGIIQTARLSASDPSFVGNLIELSAITAVVVGGTPLSGGRVRIVGTLAGAMLMQLISATLITHNLPDSATRMVQAGDHPCRRLHPAPAERFVTAATGTPDGLDPVYGSAPAPVDDAARVATRRERVAALLQRSGAFLILAVVTVIASLVFGTRFASVDNFLNILEASSFLGLIAVGMTFVIIGGGIDLSVGSVLALSAVLAAYGSQYGSVVAVALPMVVCGLIGLFNGLLIARARMAAFIVTLAALLFARGLAFAVSDEGNTIFHLDSQLAVIWLGQGSIVGVRVPIIIAAIAFIVGWVVLTRTRYGMAVTAIGGSEDAARLMGLPIARVKTAMYLTSGLLAGLAGLLVAARSSSGQSTIGVGLELQAIAAVVIGGTLLTGGSGSMTGTLAGVLLLNVINNVINQVGTLSSYFQQVVSGLFLIIVVLIQRYLSREQRL